MQNTIILELDKELYEKLLAAAKRAGETGPTTYAIELIADALARL